MANKENNFQIKLAENKLIKEGYKLTQPRKIIINFLSKSPRLYDAESLYLDIRKDNPDVGIATVYRTLDLLAKLQIINRIILGSGKTYYIFKKENHKQSFIYMICTNCGKIITDNECLDNSIKITLKDNYFEDIFKKCKLKVDNFQVLFSGLCKECKNP